MSDPPYDGLDPDAFNLEEMDAELASTPFAGRLRYFPTIHSTNTFAMQQAAEDAPEGMVYFADEQTAGRGRGAHAWHSAAGSGLYASVLLRPQIAPADVLWLSLAAGLAVREGLRKETTLDADSRWPNDLLLGGRKFCGILTELNAEVTRVRYAVVGIGINVHQESFPPELKAKATSLRIETGRHWPRQALLISLLKQLYGEVQALTASVTRAADSIRGRLESGSTWVKGKHVTVEDVETFSGITAGLDSRGFLLVQTPAGLRTVLSGGVREYSPQSAEVQQCPRLNRIAE